MAKFRMFKIGVEQFAILADAPSANVNIESKMSIDFAKEDGNIRINMAFDFLDGVNKLMVLKMNCEFNIFKDDWNSFIADNKIVVPKDLIDFLIVQTVGTARGVLHCKTDGTPFNYMVLPPMDVSQMVKNDLIIDL